MSLGKAQGVSSLRPWGFTPPPHKGFTLDPSLKPHVHAVLGKGFCSAFFKKRMGLGKAQYPFFKYLLPMFQKYKNSPHALRMRAATDMEKPSIKGFALAPLKPHVYAALKKGFMVRNLLCKPQLRCGGIYLCRSYTAFFKKRMGLGMHGKDRCHSHEVTALRSKVLT